MKEPDGGGGHDPGHSAWDAADLEKGLVVQPERGAGSQPDASSVLSGL